MKFVKKLFVICFISIGAVSSLYPMDNQDALKIIKLGSEQAEKLPRAMKNYIAVMLHMNFSDPKKGLKKNIEDLDILNEKLTKLITEGEERALQDEAVVLWKKSKENAVKQPSLEILPVMRKDFFALFDNRLEMIDIIQKKIGTKESKELLLISKCSILPQKFAGMYMLLKNSKGEERDKIVKVLKGNIEMYEKSIEGISTINPTSPILEKLKMNLAFLKYIMRPEAVFAGALVFNKTNKMSKDAADLLK